MAGSTSTLRVAGLPSGYPAEIDASVKIRWVDNLLINMSERSTDLLKYLGGTSQFVFTNPKVEWVEDDQWGRRPTHGGLAAAGTTSLTVTAQAHRFPVGTLLKNVNTKEIVRVSAIADANTLTITRDANGASLAAAWASTDEVIVAGYAMSEDQDWTFRPSAILGLPFNYAQVAHFGVQATYRRQATALYGLTGTDLDYQSANAVAEAFVGFEEGLVLAPTRYEGSGTTKPAQFGGLPFYITSANGAQETDLGSFTVQITRKDIEDALQGCWYSVGPEKMARTLVASAWIQRRVDSWFAQSERMTPGTTMAGSSIRSFMTAFGQIDVLMHTAVAKSEAYLLRRENIKMGHYAGLGRPHLLQLASPSATGPRVQRAFYGDVSAMVKGVQGMAHIYDAAISE